ncbi:MAG TPA: IclR family transcriptional regulator [Noviherbaspirillum sp.]|nr:IclR family transcriptional regulator [Noviherbaspirillum sp.]
MDDEVDNQRLGIQSVEIAAEILRGLASAGHAIPLKEVAKRCGYPAGKVHRYLVSLTREGLVDQDPSSGYYGIGRGAVAIGLSGLWASSPVREAAKTLAQLRDTTGETCFGSIWTDVGPIVSLLEESDRPVYMNVRVGAVLPLQSSASGRLFSAYLPEKVVAQAASLQEKIVGDSGRFSSEEERRADIISTIRLGYATVSGLVVPGVTAVAAPVFDYRGKIVLAIGILGRQEELPLTEETPQIKALLEASRSTSARLGYQVNSM